MAVVKPITFWPSQQQFWNCGPQVCGLMAGVGSGKSYIGCLKTIYLLNEYPGSRAVIVRQRATQLRKTILPTVLKILPRDQITRRNFNEGSLTLKNGSELLFMHLDGGEESLSNLKSLEINFFYIDQAEDIAEVAFDTLLERIGRWSGATKRGGWPKDWPHKNRLGENIPPKYPMLSFYSPGFESWITRRFWEHGEEREKYRAQGYQIFFGSTRDNLALSQEYLDGRLAMGDEYVRRFVDAVDWGAKEGRIFDLRPESILEPSEDLLNRIRRTMRLHRVYDHGEAVPSACLWYATDSDSNVYFYMEYGAADKLVSDHRAAIYELSKRDGDGSTPPLYSTNLADPAIFAKNRGRGVNAPPTWSVADEWSDKRLIDPKTAVYWRPANNDEAMTINRVREYLRVDPRHRHPITRKMGAPRAFFIRRTVDYPYGCHEVLTDIRAAKREEVGLLPDGTKLYGDKRDEHVRDHWLDCVRYSIGMRPALGPQAPSPPAEPGTIRLNEYEKLMEEENARAKAEFARNYRGASDWGY